MEFELSPPVDWISNLPEAIIDDILMRLKTHEAAKICIWWKQWRYKWAELPHLIIDNALWKGSELLQDPREIEESNETSTRKFLLFLDQVLLHHEGPTTKLSFVVPELESNSRVDRLIDLLSDHGVEEFTFELNDHYEFPSSLFLYSQLKHLKLVEGWIRPPPLTFKGFHRLVRLELHNVGIDGEVIENLVSSCPKLEYLILSGTNEFTRFEIDALMLKFLYFKCAFATIHLKRTPRLETVIVKGYECNDSDSDDEFFPLGICYFVEFFESLPALRKLSMDLYAIQVLAACEVQTRLPTLLIHLKTLKLSHIYLDELVQLSCVISLIRSSPNLEELEIMSCGLEAPHAAVLEFLEDEDFSNVLFDQLQKVRLLRIADTVPQIKLIKLLLEKSSKLESMVIHYYRLIQPNSIEGRRVVEEVNNFKALSPDAKVIHKFVR